MKTPPPHVINSNLTKWCIIFSSCLQLLTFAFSKMLYCCLGLCLSCWGFSWNVRFLAHTQGVKHFKVNWMLCICGAGGYCWVIWLCHFIGEPFNLSLTPPKLVRFTWEVISTLAWRIKSGCQCSGIPVREESWRIWTSKLLSILLLFFTICLFKDSSLTASDKSPVFCHNGGVHLSSRRTERLWGF